MPNYSVYHDVLHIVKFYRGNTVSEGEFVNSPISIDEVETNDVENDKWRYKDSL